MPLIKPRTNPVKTVRHITRLQEPNRDALVHRYGPIGVSGGNVDVGR